MISSVIVISSKKFLGGAYDREEQFEWFKIHGDLFLNHWIRNVTAIPGQKKINVMQCRNSNMKRILNRPGGNDGLLDKRSGQANHVVRYREDGYPRKCRKPFLRSLWIASGALLPNRLGNKKFIVRA
jgi:hypothetical protein